MLYRPPSQPTAVTSAEITVVVVTGDWMHLPFSSETPVHSTAAAERQVIMPSLLRQTPMLVSPTKVLLHTTRHRYLSCCCYCCYLSFLVFFFSFRPVYLMELSYKYNNFSLSHLQPATAPAETDSVLLLFPYQPGKLSGTMR